MQTLCLVWGILAAVGMLIGFVPCLGALNWVNIPFAGVGAIVSVIGLSGERGPDKGSFVAGIALCSMAAIFGLGRLVLGGGLV